MSKWIWLDSTLHPECDRIFTGDFGDNSHQNYTVANFTKEYSFPEEAESIELFVSGDTLFVLSINGDFVLTGPPCSGGDFLTHDPAPKHYGTRMTCALNGKALSFSVLVRASRVVSTDYSRGHGGFFLDGTVRLKSGKTVSVGTDGTWLAEKNTHYIKPYVYDERRTSAKRSYAEEITDLRNAEAAPIPLLTEERILPENGSELIIPPHGECEKTFFFDKIYAAYVCLTAETGEFSAELNVFELPEVLTTHESVYVLDGCRFRSIQLHSVGGFTLKVKNLSDTAVTVKPHIVSTHYPITEEGLFFCDDEDTNLTVRVCTHTLKICRQTLHLDSPRHQEPLACTGDYNIEMLMEAFAFGDLRLARFDLMRTADWLTQNDGRMFHTTYSLIFVSMLLDYHTFTGDLETVDYCMTVKRGFTSAGSQIKQSPRIGFPKTATSVTFLNRQTRFVCSRVLQRANARSA